MTYKEFAECMYRFGVATAIITAFVMVGALVEWIAHG